MHQRKSKIGGQQRCVAQVRWSNEDVLHKFVGQTKMYFTISLVKRRWASQVCWSNEDVLHIFVGQTKICSWSLLSWLNEGWSNEDLQLIFVALAQRRCVPHLRWSNEDLLLIFVNLTNHLGNLNRSIYQGPTIGIRADLNICSSFCVSSRSFSCKNKFPTDFLHPKGVRKVPKALWSV